MNEIIYTTKSPVLFLIFNRPDVTSLVFEEIRKVKPNKLYIAADGPRTFVEDEIILCNETRKIISAIDWDCEVKTLFRENNLGCKYAVSSAINWFFEQEEEGIILEDDCLPNYDFFRFCDEMLLKYRLDNRIRFITGSNFQKGTKHSNSSYYFSNLTHVWGWASWRTAWKDYDVELENYKELDHYKLFFDIFNNTFIANDWKEIIEKLYNNEINTWDYQWTITNMFNNGLSIIPNVNLISNIGFGNNATHTFNNNGFDTLPYGKLDDVLVHPTIFLPSKEADLFVLKTEHNIQYRTKRAKKERVKKWLKFWKK